MFEVHARYDDCGEHSITIISDTFYDSGDLIEEEETGILLEVVDCWLNV